METVVVWNGGRSEEMGGGHIKVGPTPRWIHLRPVPPPSPRPLLRHPLRQNRRPETCTRQPNASVRSRIWRHPNPLPSTTQQQQLQHHQTNFPRQTIFGIHQTQTIIFFIITLFLFISSFSFQDYYDYDDKLGVRYPNFNFNVSHHGHYVAIASEPLCLVGIDIVSYAVPCGETVAEFIQCFSSYFSSLEWDNIVNAGTCDDDVLIEFYRYCYTKSINQIN